MQSQHIQKYKKKKQKQVRPVLDPDPVLDPQYPRIRIWVLQNWTRGSGSGSGSCSWKRIWIRVHLDPVLIRPVAIPSREALVTNGFNPRDKKKYWLQTHVGDVDNVHSSYVRASKFFMKPNQFIVTALAVQSKEIDSNYMIRLIASLDRWLYQISSTPGIFILW